MQNNQELEALRKKIDLIDAAIIEKLVARQKLSKEIGQLKAQLGREIVDKEREKYLFHYHEELCARYHLSPTFIKQLFELIILDSQRLQKLEI